MQLRDVEKLIHRCSSRRSPLKDFLATQLQGARRYDRIAGFFSSSLLEVAGEALERMTPEGGETCVRAVCNSCSVRDVHEILTFLFSPVGFNVLEKRYFSRLIPSHPGISKPPGAVSTSMGPSSPDPCFTPAKFSHKILQSDFY